MLFANLCTQNLLSSRMFMYFWAKIMPFLLLYHILSVLVIFGVFVVTVMFHL